MDTSVSTVFLGVFVVFLYLVPAFAAYSKRHRSADAVLPLNLLFGWTMIGWIGALIWAYSGPYRPDVNPPDQSHTRLADTIACPYCAETIKAAAIMCRFCGKELLKPATKPRAELKDDWQA